MRCRFKNVMERQKFRKFLQIVCPVLIAHLSIFSTIMIADEWDESYENGKAALQRGEWHAADSLFQIALSFRPDPDLQAATSALKLIEYLPHYFLGQAYFFAGRYTPALQSFQKSAQSGAVSKTQHLARLQRLMKTTEMLIQFSEQKRQESDKAGIEKEISRLQNLLSDGNYNQAAALLTRLKGNHSEDRRINILEDWLQEQQVRFDFESDKPDAGSEAEGRFSKGLDGYLVGRYEQALEEFKAAEQLDPNFSAARSWIERTRTEMQRLNLAESESKKPPPEPQIIQTFIQQTPAPVFVIRTPNETLSETRSKYIDLSGRVGDDQGIAYIEFTVNAKPLLDSAGKRTKIYPPENEKSSKFSFFQRIPLQLGENEIVLTAYDVDSTVHRTIEQLTIQRNPPIYKTAGFFVSAGAIILLPVGFFFIFRIVKYRIAIVNKYNPYIAGSPIINEAMFFGREKLIKRILNTIHNNSLMIYGPRRIGKTSMQHQLRQRLEKLDDPVYHFIPVMIDLQGSSEEQFFAVLMEEIIEACKSNLNGNTSFKITDRQNDYTSRDFGKDLKKLLQSLKSEEEKKLKLVLLIDEVDELNKFSERVNQKLRSVFMKTFAENLVAVMSGAHIRKNWESEGSPWYNFFEEIEVPPLDKEHAVELIRQPVAGIFSYDAVAVTKIIEYSECKPYTIQRYCVNAINRIIEQKRRRVTAGDVEAVAKVLSA